VFAKLDPTFENGDLVGRLRIPPQLTRGRHRNLALRSRGDGVFHVLLESDCRAKKPMELGSQAVASPRLPRPVSTLNPIFSMKSE